MANLRRSMIINFFSSSGSTLLLFVSSLIVARMLSPSEIGVYSMTVVVVNLAHVFRDFGVSTYLQREKELTDEKLRAATGVLFCSSWSIAVLLLIASPWIGNWFNEPASTPVVQVLAIGFFFIPFGAITHALLARELAAEKETWLNAAGTVSYCISCIAMAKMGLGTMSLAYANLINIIVCAIACIPFRPKYLPWLPSFRHWRGVASFGAGALLSSCCTALNNAIPDILLGKIGTARKVGLLSRANSTVAMFSYVAGSTVSYGAVSYFAQAHHRNESLQPMLARASTLLTGVGWTALALSTVLGRDIVLALYGPTWIDCVPAILPLSIAGAINMAFHYIPIAVTSIGRPYLSTVPTALMVVSRILLCVLLFDGTLARFSWALCLATAATVPVICWQQKRYFGYAPGLMLRKLAPSALVALGTALAGYALDWLAPSSLPSLLRLLILAAPLAAVWYGLLRVTGHDLVEEIHRAALPVKARLAALLRPRHAPAAPVLPDHPVRKRW